MCSPAFKLLSALCFLGIFIHSPNSWSLPRALKSANPNVRAIACDLLLSLNRAEKLASFFSSGRALDLEGEMDADIFGVLHDLAGYPLEEMRGHILHSPQRRETLAAQGGASIGAPLNTPVSDLRRIEEVVKFRSGEQVVDLGSGHGAPAFYFGVLYPETDWLGLELVDVKVRAASAVVDFLDLRNVHFRRADLLASDFRLPLADTYYLLNPVPDVRPLFAQLEEIRRKRKIRVIALAMSAALSQLDLSGYTATVLPARGFLESPIMVLESR